MSVFEKPKITKNRQKKPQSEQFRILQIRTSLTKDIFNLYLNIGYFDSHQFTVAMLCNALEHVL